jgi:hypothetical protein
MTPIGTKHAQAESLLEQRTGATYHQRYPWPDRDAMRIQHAYLGGASPRAQWGTALTYLLAVVCGLGLVLKGCT